MKGVHRFPSFGCESHPEGCEKPRYYEKSKRFNGPTDVHPKDLVLKTHTVLRILPMIEAVEATR